MPSKTDVLRVRLVTDGAGKVKAEMLGVDSSFRRVEKSSSTLGIGIKSLASAFSLLSVASIGAAVKNSVAFADSIDKASERAGLGATALQELRFAAEQVGVSTQQLDDGFRRFTRRIGVFANEGGGPAAKTFENLGISIRDVNGEVRGSEAIFEDLVKELEDVESAAERSAIAAQVFGDDAGPQLRLLLDQGSEGIRRLRQEAQDIGAVLSDDVIDNAVQAQDTLAKMSNVIRAQLTTALIELAPLLTSTANGIIKLVSSTKEFFNLDLTAIQAYQRQIGILENKIAGIQARMKSGLFNPFGKSRQAQRLEQEQEILQALTDIKTLETAIEHLSKTSEDNPPLGTLGSGEAADNIQAAEKALERLQNRLNPLQAKVKQYAEDLKTIEQSDLGLNEKIELTKKLNKELADATGGSRKLTESFKTVNKEIKTTSTEGEKVITTAFSNAAQNIQGAFGDTFTEIYRNGVTSFDDLADAIKDIMARLAGEITALMIFRPSILSGGIGGIGLLGSGGAAAGAGGGALAGGAGGILGLSALGLAGGLLAGGGFKSSQGLGGGLLGGAAGGYGGLLLGSSTALGPLGIPLGIALGSFLGSSFGGLFGGGDDNQKFGFATGASGVPTPFGNLAVTSAQDVDASAILQSLVSIDEGIADLLSPEQIARVQSGLAGTGQFFDVKSFDNEPFDVVQTRLVRIIDSVAENTVASGLLNVIGRDPGNIDTLVSEAGRIIELITLFQDQGEPLNDAETALQAINDQFAELADVATSLGFSVDQVNAQLADATAQLTTDFNASIRQQVLAIDDPLRAAIEAEQRFADERLENAKSLGADINEVERLNALRRNAIVEKSFKDFASSNSSISNFLQSLKITGAGGLSVGAQAGNAEGIFNSLLGQARTSPTARADLAALLPSLLSSKRSQLGSTPEFFEFTNFLDQTLRNLVDQTETVTTLNDVGAAITTGDNAIVATLREEIGSLRDEIVVLNSDINLLLNAPQAA